MATTPPGDQEGAAGATPPEQPATPARAPVPAGAAARPAASAAPPAGPTVPYGQTQGIKTSGATAVPAGSPPTTDAPGAVRQGMVMVWPQLVSIEFVAILVMTLVLVLMGILLNSPLEDLANPDRTPNPSKAPWYFLNLQELLLHMHPSLAGVLVPGIALALIAAIPYVDNNPEGTGRWFTNERGLPITLFATAYTLGLEIIMILFNEYVGVRRIFQDTPEPIKSVMPNVIIPVVIMVGLSVLLAYIVKRRYNANTREILIALFTGFVASFFLLTLVGSAARGEGMHLYWPWEKPAPH